MKPIYRVGDVAVFRNEWGRVYGLREIGTRKSWYRWETPDGRRHRFAKDACRYLDGIQLARSAREARERREAEAAEAARREERCERYWAQKFEKLAERWSAKVDARPDRLARVA